MALDKKTLRTLRLCPRYTRYKVNKMMLHLTHFMHQNQSLRSEI